MKQIIIAFAAIVVLSFAGLAFSQTPGSGTVQPGTASNPSGTELALTNPSDTQPATPQAGDPAATTASQAQAAPSAAAEPAAQPAAAQAESKSLPATAGSNPLMLSIGVLALVAFATILVRATRRVSHS
jgi:hypothetical protein